MATPDGFGANGGFMVSHPKINNYVFFCMVSDQLGWDHVSITLHQKKTNIHRSKVYVGGRTKIVKKTNEYYDPVGRCPTWEEMCFIKSVFWEDEEEVVQFHPAKKDHVNNHQYCLHLWRPTIHRIDLPPKEFVGFTMPEDPSDQLLKTNK